MLLAPLVVASGADPSRPHIHTGIMQKYEAIPPSKYGIELRDATPKSLRSGRPTLRLIESEDRKRIVTIQDIQASEKLVWQVITDLNNYPKMVDGCDECAIYKTTKQLGGKRTDYARYRIGGMGFSMEYFVKHIFEPSKHCFTFHLDYDRLSQLSDTVGYWYVEQLNDGWCRVYYSTDSTLPSWIPGFAQEGVVSFAAKRATSWVDKHCQIRQGTAPSKRMPLTKQRLVQLALLGGLLRQQALSGLGKLRLMLRHLPLRLPRLPMLSRVTKSAD